MEMLYILDIITDREVPFRVTYGIRFYNGVKTHPYPVVAFYDRRFPHSEHGQFVGDYMSETMLNSETGLLLDSDQLDWTIDRHAMRLVRAWLRDILARS